MQQRQFIDYLPEALTRTTVLRELRGDDSFSRAAASIYSLSACAATYATPQRAASQHPRCQQ